MTVYVAEVDGPPRLKMWIYNDNIGDERPSRLPSNESGWCFVVEEVHPDKDPTPIYDGWEREFSDILKYPKQYFSGKIKWVDEDSGLPVALPLT